MFYRSELRIDCTFLPKSSSRANGPLREINARGNPRPCEFGNARQRRQTERDREREREREGGGARRIFVIEPRDARA
jgi:hypothetical protein